MVDISRFKNLDLDKVRQYELDLARGIAKSDSPEDHARMMEAIALMRSIPSAPAPATPAQKPTQGLTIEQTMDKLFQLSAGKYKPSTTVAYKGVAKEFASFLNNPSVTAVGRTDVTRYKEWLALKGKSPRTIDNKIGNIRKMFSFAISHAYYFGDNPATGMNIQSKSDKQKTAYEIFTPDEIKNLFSSLVMTPELKRDPDYFWCLMLALLCGCRISEITSLTSKQIKKSDGGIHYIDITDSKTLAGIRQVPIPATLYDNGFVDFIKGKKKLFKYKDRLGKGSGNAVGQKFTRQRKKIGIDRNKLVLHSLRKFLNNELKIDGLPMEVRCQLMGHDVDNVNNELYSADLTVDKLHDRISATQSRIMELVGFPYLLNPNLPTAKKSI